MALGLCTPNHVWQAWADQLILDPTHPPTVDLNAIGIDAQAVASFPLELAIDYGVLPIRLVGGMLILAARPDGADRARRELPGRLTVAPRFVLASDSDITRALEICYLPLQACA
jgi:hypothetical protein